MGGDTSGCFCTAPEAETVDLSPERAEVKRPFFYCRVSQEVPERCVECLGGKAQQWGAGTDAEVLGPSPAPHSRLRGMYRIHALVKGVEAEAIRVGLAWVLENVSAASAVSVNCDVDPYGML